MLKTRLGSPWWVLLGSAALACGGDGDGGTNPPPRVPTTINPTGTNQTGIAGAALATPITVTVLDQDGDPMSGVSVTFAVMAGGGSLGTPTSATNASGVASTSWTLGTASGTNNNQVSVSVTGYGGPGVGFTASAAAGAADSIAKSAGEAQTGEVMQPLAIPPTVILRDAYNNPAAGVTVFWTVLGGGGSVSSPSSTTNAQGEASIAWTLGPAVAAVHHLRASAGALNTTFTATGALSAGTLTLYEGDNQSTIINTNVAVLPAVIVKTSGPAPAPVANVQVQWDVIAGGGHTGGVAITLTREDGIARNGWHIGDTVGHNNQGLTAAVASLTGSPVTFVASAVNPPTQLAAFAGDSQTSAAGQALSEPLVVVMRDSLGIGVGGITVAWMVTEGDGSLSASYVQTDTAGRSSVSWTVGTVAGARNEVTASSAGLAGSPVTFSATVVAAAASQVAISSGNNQTATVGTALAQPIAVVVRDQFNNVKAGVTVNWAAAQGSVSAPTSVSDAAGVASIGWTIGTVAGTSNQAASATVAGLTGSPVAFTASGTAGAAAALAIAGGDNQSATVGSALPTPLAALVTDAYGNGVSGVDVSWAAATGGGSMAAATTQTGVGGAASNTWTLGSTVGGQTATASVAGTTPTMVTFSATASAVVSNFNITLRYLTTMSPARQAVFAAAATRWSSVITGDLSDVIGFTAPDSACGPNSPALNETIDDVLIFVTLDSMDGPGAKLGSAGPCYIRVGTRFPVVGQMRFDTADVAFLEANNILQDVMLHEMGHVLGIGGLWTDPFAMLPNLLVGKGGPDPYFNGTGAIARFNASGGGVYAGLKVPVENTGGPGTRDAHWRESVMGKELMTGWVSVVANPLSAITVASLKDMGYTVNLAGSDPYTVDGTNLRAGQPAGEYELRERAPDWTIKAVDAQGRIVGQR